MSKVLLLGGTGAMGVYLSELLAEMGYDVCVTSRSVHGSPDRIRYVCGDAHDKGFVECLLRNERPDAVVDFMMYSTDEFAVRLGSLLGGTSHYVYLSSYRVFSNEVPLVEMSPKLLDVVDDPAYLSTDEYALAKARQENVLRRSEHRNWTIVRPSITYSRERFQFGCLEADVVCYRTLQGLSVVMPEEMLSRRTTMTWGRDVALMISRLVLNSNAHGEDYNVVTAESTTWGDVAKVYSDTIGMVVKTIPLADYCNVCSETQVRYDRMFDRVMDNAKCLAATGLSQSDLTPLAVALPQELERFSRCPRYRKVNVRQNAMIDLLCNERISLKGLSLREKIQYLRILHPGLEYCVRPLSIVKRCLRKIA